MDTPDAKADANSLQILLNSHRRFLAFLESRVGSIEDAEEILQVALIKAIQQEESLKQETVVAWFYRVQKNALTDHYRRRNAEKRAMEQHLQVKATRPSESIELERTVCECFKELIPILKPEYGEILKIVDLGNASLTDAAKSLGITANNATVRLHRARLALKKSLAITCKTCAVHGCYDCTCKKCRPRV
ncbi:MAG: sigma-70 family RNA polymerase sigma factor [Burkholderiales bacterium]